MLSKNCDNKVAIHCGLQIIQGYLSETPGMGVAEAATLHQSDNFTSNHF